MEHQSLPMEPIQPVAAIESGDEHGVLRGDGTSYDVRIHKPAPSVRLGISLVNSCDGDAAVLVSEVIQGGLAAASGLISVHQGLVAVNGKRVRDQEHAAAMLRSAVGDVELTLMCAPHAATPEVEPPQLTPPAAASPAAAVASEGVRILTDLLTGHGGKLEMSQLADQLYARSEMARMEVKQRGGIRKWLQSVAAFELSQLEYGSGAWYVSLRISPSKAPLLPEVSSGTGTDGTSYDVRIHKPAPSVRLGISLVNSCDGDAAVLVSEVIQGGLAAASGLISVHQGLVAVNGKRVRDQEHAAAMLRSAVGDVELTLMCAPHAATPEVEPPQLTPPAAASPAAAVASEGLSKAARKPRWTSRQKAERLEAPQLEEARLEEEERAKEASNRTERAKQVPQTDAGRSGTALLPPAVRPTIPAPLDVDFWDEYERAYCRARLRDVLHVDGQPCHYRLELHGEHGERGPAGWMRTVRVASVCPSYEWPAEASAEATATAALRVDSPIEVLDTNGSETWWREATLLDVRGSYIKLRYEGGARSTDAVAATHVWPARPPAAQQPVASFIKHSIELGPSGAASFHQSLLDEAHAAPSGQRFKRLMAKAGAPPHACGGGAICFMRLHLSCTCMRVAPTCCMLLRTCRCAAFDAGGAGHPVRDGTGH